MPLPSTPHPQRISLNGEFHQAEWLLETVKGQSLLASVYQERTAQPYCQCSPDAKMYIAKRGTRFYLARMPGSGYLHTADCPSVEENQIAVNDLFSGATRYPDGAIKENADGELLIELGFGSPGIDGLLDMLIEGGGLHTFHGEHHTPGWIEVRDKLSAAAENILVGGITPLSSLLLLPGKPHQSNEQSIKQGVQSFVGAQDQLRYLCAPMKEFTKTPFGWCMTLKYLPYIRFWISHTVGETLLNRLPGGVSLDAFPEYGLCFASIRPAKNGGFTVLDLAFRRTDIHFLPCISDQEAEIFEELIQQGRQFFRPLRFDCSPETVLADFVLTDTVRGAHVGFILSPTGCRTLDASKRTTAHLLSRSLGTVSIWDQSKWILPLPDRATPCI